MASATDTGVRGSRDRAPDARSLAGALDLLGAFVDAFEPARYSGEDAEELVSVFTRVERLGAAGKILAATRAAETNRHGLSGHRSPAEWLAARTGGSIGEAKDALELGEDLSSHPGVGDALRSGTLAPKRAQMIARVVREDPTKEETLLQGARTDNHKQFTERCLRAAAEGRSEEQEEARARRIHRKRRCSTWTDVEGFHLNALLTPESGAKVAASLADQTDAVFSNLSRRGLVEHRDAMAADALVALVTGEGILSHPRRARHDQTSGTGTGQTSGTGQTGGHTRGTSGTGPDSGTGPAADHDRAVSTDRAVSSHRDRTTPTARTTPTPGAPTTPTCTNCAARGGRPGTRGTVLVRVDLEALRRGSTGEGELCEIPGVGPIPVSHARERLGDDLVYLVVTNGVDVTTIARMGRHIPESLRVAIIERDQCCVVPHCGVRNGLETDHWQVEYAKGGLASLDNLCRLCQHHHDLKTTKGWRLTGGPGRWEFLPPTTPTRPKKRRPPKRPPPPGEPDPSLFDPGG